MAVKPITPFLPSIFLERCIFFFWGVGETLIWVLHVGWALSTTEMTYLL